MKIKIAYLYYDLLNLYGEQGNITALVNSFKNQNIETEIDYLSCNNKIDFNKYEIYYMGTGSMENLLIVLDNIKKYKNDIKKAIENQKYIIATGNSYLLLGKFIENNENKYECLDVFDYYAKENPSRIIGDSFMKYNDLPIIIGFQNRNFVVHNDSNHLFNVLKGYADNYKSTYEGYHGNNFYGTYMIGPLLIRNPAFTEEIVKNILINNNLKYHEDNDNYLFKAHDEYLKNFYEK